MENKINIAEILRDKPQGTKLYSPICDECVLKRVATDLGQKYVVVEETVNYCNSHTFYEGGRLFLGKGECLLFPSKKMRDWSKFAWKKGDVLVSNDGGTKVIFYGWYDDTYTNFYGKHYLNSEDENNIKYCEQFLCTTDRYSLESKDAAQTYINTIEKRLGGKLNMETLEIEKPEFKDGDIVKHNDNSIVLVRKVENKKVYHHTVLRGSQFLEYPSTPTSFYGLVGACKGYATEEEKQQLFNALKKEGKRWNAETKQIEDIKPKWTPKPFDKVLVRDTDREQWRCNFFSHIWEKNYVCAGGIWAQCIPYNEETAHLVGTTDDWEG